MGAEEDTEGTKRRRGRNSGSNCEFRSLATKLSGNGAGDLTSGAGDTNRVVVRFLEVGTCLKTTAITSGKFPSGSYVMGESVSFEIETDNGDIVFLGKAKEDGLIRGNYPLANSTCEPAGT